jgi:hypothetical protein
MEEFHSKHGILNEERHAKQLIGQWGTSQGILRLTALDAECADCAGPELDLCVVRRLPKLPSEGALPRRRTLSRARDPIVKRHPELVPWRHEELTPWFS